MKVTSNDLELDIEHIRSQNPSDKMLEALDYFVDNGSILVSNVSGRTDEEKSEFVKEALNDMREHSNTITANAKRYQNITDEDLLDLEEYVKARKT